MVRPPSSQPRRRRNNLVFYLLLNVIVSAATTLGVLAIWDATRPPAQAPADQPVVLLPTATATIQAPTATLPPLDQTIVEIISVIGAGDLAQENVVIHRTGAGTLRMVGWQLVGEQDNRYVFPEQPELTLLEGAEIQVYSRPGDDTVTALYWNRSAPAWHNGETIRLIDSAGNERARYIIP